MKKSQRRRWWIYAGVIFLILGFGLIWKDLKRLGQIVPAFHAKELCTCLFVNRQTAPYCAELVRQWIPTGTAKIDEGQKTVEAIFMRSHRKAQWVSERFGCQLNPLD